MHGHQLGKTIVLGILAALEITSLLFYSRLQAQGPFGHDKVTSSQVLHVGGAEIQVDFAQGQFDGPASSILHAVETAAKAVSAYYRRFPVTRARVLIVPVSGDGIHGTTWGNIGNFQGFTRMRIGTHVSE